MRRVEVEEEQAMDEVEAKEEASTRRDVDEVVVRSIVFRVREGGSDVGDGRVV